mmetsp:Transcript_37916/g.95293  ORF Transcript_37916/g.95293 Transcript_37916/m.95293 type:complete len:203 (+) Transcript_37916:340-948(+)
MADGVAVDVDEDVVVVVVVVEDVVELMVSVLLGVCGVDACFGVCASSWCCERSSCRTESSGQETKKQQKQKRQPETRRRTMRMIETVVMRCSSSRVCALVRCVVPCARSMPHPQWWTNASRRRRRRKRKRKMLAFVWHSSILMDLPQSHGAVVREKRSRGESSRRQEKPATERHDAVWSEHCRWPSVCGGANGECCVLDRSS